MRTYDFAPLSRSAAGFDRLNEARIARTSAGMAQATATTAPSGLPGAAVPHRN
jgi:hypothetical protein